MTPAVGTAPQSSVWAPLEQVLGPNDLPNYMFMNIVNAEVESNVRVDVYLYKHRMNRTYLNVDRKGNRYVWVGDDRYTQVPQCHAPLGGLTAASPTLDLAFHEKRP